MRRGRVGDGGIVMKFRYAAFAVGLICMPALAGAEGASIRKAGQAGEASTGGEAVTVAAGLGVPLSLTSEISSSRSRLGDMVPMVVAADVVSDGIVVIPRGTRAFAEITVRSGRGVFGKSGKMEVSFRYLDLDGVRVPLDGAHFQAGEGNTVGTIGAVVAAGVVGGMVVTGRSANVSERTIFTARTIDPLPMIVGRAGAAGPDRPIARLAPGYTPSPVQTGSAHLMAAQAAAEAERMPGPRAGESCATYAHRRSADSTRAWRIEQECRRARDRAAPIR